MRRDMIIVDDFYADPDAIVRYALSLDYVFPYNTTAAKQAGRPISWRASRFKPARDCPLKSSTELKTKLEFLTGEKIDIDF